MWVHDVPVVSAALQILESLYLATAMISPQEGRSLFQQSLGCLTPARAARKLDVGPDVESLLECPICMTVVVKPVVTPCGHLFCEGCIAKYVHETHRGGALSGAQCPQCRQSIALGKLVDVSFVSKLVECLAVASPAIKARNSISRREAESAARVLAARADDGQLRFGDTVSHRMFRLATRDWATSRATIARDVGAAIRNGPAIRHLQHHSAAHT